MVDANRYYAKEALRFISAGIKDPMRRLVVMADAFSSYIKVARAFDPQGLLNSYRGNMKARVKAQVYGIIGDL